MTCSYCQKEKHSADSCFEAAKAVSFVSVLDHYGIEHYTKQTAKGPEIRTKRCPFQRHSGKSPGALSINPADGKFNCFSCHEKGKGTVQFVRKVEGIEDQDAAKLINGWFHAVGVEHRADAEQHRADDARLPGVPEVPPRNIPLAEKFKDKGWDGRLRLEYHSYLEQRGFSKELCEEMGVGFASKGKMAGRICFPIHNLQGQLVSYAGRIVGDGEPRWYQYAGFQKSLELYNLHRAVELDPAEIVVVESFWGVLACLRAEIPNVVALMGSEMSQAQEELLHHFGCVSLMLDGDEPGREATVAIGQRLVSHPYRSVRIVRLPDGEQPDTVSPDLLQSLLF